MSPFPHATPLLLIALAACSAQSPAMDAAWPWLIEVTGGRQSARSLHFIGMALIALFILVHLTLVILADPINELKSMITGWWTLPEDEA